MSGFLYISGERISVVDGVEWAVVERWFFRLGFVLFILVVYIFSPFLSCISDYMSM